MGESMKDYENELEASFKKIEEGDILTGTVISVDENGVILDLKYYAEGVIPAEAYSREPGFNLKEEVHVGDEISATVTKKDDGHGNILLSKVEANDVLSWQHLQAMKDSGEVLDVVVKGVVKGGVIAYVLLMALMVFIFRAMPMKASWTASSASYSSLKTCFALKNIC